MEIILEQKAESFKINSELERLFLEQQNIITKNSIRKPDKFNQLDLVICCKTNLYIREMI